MTEQTVDVTLAADGIVEIGVPPRGPGAHFFPVFGGLVGVDVVDPDCAPFASLVDVTRAAWWLEAVYGAAVAAAAVELAPDRDEDAADHEQPHEIANCMAVPVSPGHLWSPLTRFGIGTWIQRWWPTSDGGPRVHLDETLMDLENGVLAWSLEFVLGGTATAAALLEGHVSAVLDSLENRSPDNALLGPALRAIIESVPVTDEQYNVLREHESRLELVTVEVAALTDEALAQLSDVARATGGGRRKRSRRDPSSSLVGRGSYAPSSTSAVDVEQVPARSVSWAMDAVSGNVRSVAGGLEVEVRVRAGDVPTDEPLFARVFIGDESAPAGVVKLSREGSSYAGTARIADRPEPTEFVVDVFTPSLMASPDPARSARLRQGVEPIFAALADAARASGFEGELVQDLKPSAPWRALIAGSARRG